MSAVSDNSHLEIVEEEFPSKEEVLYYLIAVGVNSCNRSYDAQQKQMRDSFLALPLGEIALAWDHLDDGVKISVLDSHSEDFKAWVSGERR